MSNILELVNRFLNWFEMSNYQTGDCDEAVNEVNFLREENPQRNKLYIVIM